MEKAKFKPIITRIKLNPEQAVLACACYGSGTAMRTTGTRSSSLVCQLGAATRINPLYNKTTTTASNS